ncbi:unnamed protein product [Alopecurus aequalis]
MYALAPPHRAPAGSPAAAASSVPPHVLHRLQHRTSRRRGADLRCRRRLLTARGERPYPDDDDDEKEEPAGFDTAVALFNGGEYHTCHDVLEELWYSAEDPVRTLLHGILQCAVGFHHLFNQNHRGAMMELGEGLCKLRRLRLEDDDGDEHGPFSRFRDEVAAVLSFLYRTQKELAACTDEMCLAMDGSATSYQLLGDFAAGQRLYMLGVNADDVPSILFSGGASSDHSTLQAAAVLSPPCTVKLPALHATEQHVAALQRAHEYS